MVCELWLVDFNLSCVNLCFKVRCLGRVIIIDGSEKAIVKAAFEVQNSRVLEGEVREKSLSTSKNCTLCILCLFYFVFLSFFLLLLFFFCFLFFFLIPVSSLSYLRCFLGYHSAFLVENSLENLFLQAGNQHVGDSRKPAIQWGGKRINNKQPNNLFINKKIKLYKIGYPASSLAIKLI